MHLKQAIFSSWTLADLYLFFQNCETGQYKNFGEGGNNKCQGFNTGKSVAFDSNKGLSLRVFASTDCQPGDEIFITEQNKCQQVPFTGLSVLAE
ncbi:hypothetical protein J4E93_003978 [Alternaria ventricosa]|uniref:uncharacterized protein n=1 Tax=Alternaria ventricosa TaxID=1187951 RepID=UPI0020C35FBC|nr:uncharacterized protein J4E93_003978 [Alternaria ventricosa]KAI4649658.1 hypothetical protein J4E93_003978 [Alternaria ventricosa]